ncbi:unnamed protein product, partial [Scytosiphon promiscuus]
GVVAGKGTKHLPNSLLLYSRWPLSFAITCSMKEPAAAGQHGCDLQRYGIPLIVFLPDFLFFQTLPFDKVRAFRLLDNILCAVLRPTSAVPHPMLHHVSPDSTAIEFRSFLPFSTRRTHAILACRGHVLPASI